MTLFTKLYNILEFRKQSHNVYKFTLFLNTIKYSMHHGLLSTCIEAE